MREFDKNFCKYYLRKMLRDFGILINLLNSFDTCNTILELYKRFLFYY